MTDEHPAHLHVSLTRDRFVNRRMLRHFAGELILAGAYLVLTIVLVVFGLHPIMLLGNISVLCFMVTTIYRAVMSYRRGFQDGLAAYPLAVMQPGVGATIYLLEHSDEIWKEHPVQVAHSMEIMRLEREANGGLTGT